VSEQRPPGRPQTWTDDEILDAALRSFAATGFEAMSIRSLNAELGLSHEAIRQRFGSKDKLYYASLDHGFAAFFRDLAEERGTRPVDLEDLEELRESIRVFIVVAGRHRALGQLISHESLQATERIDHIYTQAFEPGIAGVKKLLDRLADAGEIRQISVRDWFFLVKGAAAPFAQVALSEAFTPLAGPLDPDRYVETVTEIIMQGICHPSG
jgi:AcrR family transcriptional regulator